ncbi:hypothetical protein [Rhizobium mongolense]|uniref:Uncharacterized protein n=2 Tax=Rhizobium mongolense TaxID=57676 RepID=A0ABR6IZB2_9HYPH|nr:hypothetical protein [Rhizobium mongolense]MBB4232789.1 hypothetical protein [Rhizobium mongolense]TVZ72717.1 hypothetical protein BCL32_0897 [Rhizobium mongolense USDA 1844]
MLVSLGFVPRSFTGDRLIVARSADLKSGFPIWIRLLFMLKYKKLEGDVKWEDETCPLKFQEISAV